ncbi:hypothetical protein ACFVT1_07800 [Streptomyces sp. NPDC057963]
MIETERLPLRPVRPSDVDAFVDLHADPRIKPPHRSGRRGALE